MVWIWSHYALIISIFNNEKIFPITCNDNIPRRSINIKWDLISVNCQKPIRAAMLQLNSKQWMNLWFLSKAGVPWNNVCLLNQRNLAINCGFGLILVDTFFSFRFLKVNGTIVLELSWNWLVFWMENKKKNILTNAVQLNYLVCKQRTLRNKISHIFIETIQKMWETLLTV